MPTYNGPQTQTLIPRGLAGTLRNILSYRAESTKIFVSPVATTVFVSPKPTA